MAIEVSKLLALKEAEDRDPAAQAAAWAELKACLERFHERMEPIRADLETPDRERAKFAPLGEDTPLWYLFRNQALLRIAAQRTYRPVQTNLATQLLQRTRGTSRMHRPRCVARSGSSRDGPPRSTDDEDDLERLGPLFWVELEHAVLQSVARWVVDEWEPES